MTLCVWIAGKSAACLAGLLFSLSWTHSIEKTRWVEHWKVLDNQLQLQEIRVKGSGAGIDPAPNSELVDGWYRWKPAQPVSLPSISLANSELTPDNWQLCAINPADLNSADCIDFAIFQGRGVESFLLKPQR